MGAWSRWRSRGGAAGVWRRLRGLPRTDGEPTHNILAVSDLHLGIDLRPGLPRDRPQPVDLALGSLLAHVTAHREEGRPWRLLVVGDMVDFIAIAEAPQPGSAPFPVTPIERLHGLATEPAKSCWKLARVAERHRALFERLAAFVAAGNDLVIVRGNHDADWVFPQVQEALRTLLADLAHPPGPLRPASARHREALRAAFTQRISFVEWFYLEPGRLYAEHGHHHDEYSITEDLMRRPESPKPLSEPVSTLALRYFSNLHAGLDMSEVERWGMIDYIRWGRKNGRVARYFIDYLTMCSRVLGFSLKASTRTMLRSLRAVLRLGRDLAVEDEKLTHIKTLVRSVRADHEGLARSLAELLQPPAGHSFWATARMLYFDRMLLAAAVALGASGCLAAGGPALLRGGGLVVLGGLALAANAWLDRSRHVDSHPKLLAAAHRVAVLFGVPVVIMGHSHRTVRADVGDGALYFNLGTWMAPSTDGRSPAGFPHVVVTSTGPELRRWRPPAPAAVEVA